VKVKVCKVGYAIVLLNFVCSITDAFVCNFQVRGDVEITRKITATETTEVEHKARTQERVVQGQVVSV
jgi:hypothetical protein